MLLFFMIIIPTIYYLFLNYISSLYISLYNKICELELKLEDNNDK